MPWGVLYFKGLSSFLKVSGGLFLHCSIRKEDLAMGDSWVKKAFVSAKTGWCLHFYSMVFQAVCVPQCASALLFEVFCVCSRSFSQILVFNIHENRKRFFICRAARRNHASRNYHLTRKCLFYFLNWSKVLVYMSDLIFNETSKVGNEKRSSLESFIMNLLVASNGRPKCLVRLFF